MMSSWCILTPDRGWCLVLGGAEPEGSHAQRLCDQNLVNWRAAEKAEKAEPTCSECVRIRGLMTEFATHYEDDDERRDEEDGGGGPGAAANGAVELVASRA